MQFGKLISNFLLNVGCQIILKPELQDLEVTLPPATRNFYVDGKKPSHH